jgi:hypothetical protein
VDRQAVLTPIASPETADLPRWAKGPERRPGLTIGLVGAACLLAYTASLVLLPKPDGRIVVGDAVHYYVYLRSFVFDGDLRFRNEYVALYGLRGGEPDTEWVYAETATGHTRNLMSVGPAIVWAPLFLAVTAGVGLANLAGLAYPLDGFGRWFQAAAGWSGILAATLGAGLAYAAAARVFSRRAAVWATLAMWLGSSAVYYSAVSPAYSHASSMLAVGLYFLVWLATLDRQTMPRYAMVGALGGVAALVRWQDVVFLAAPIVDAVVYFARGRSDAPGRWTPTLADARAARATISASRAGGWRLFCNLTACAAGSLVAFGPQLWAWSVIYGAPLLIPQGEAFMRWNAPALLAVLMSDFHGLFSWTPIVALATLGAARLPARHLTVGAGTLTCLILSWYANAAAADWWAGEAFGARRFVSCFPLFVLGLAAVFDRLEHRPRWVVGVSLVLVGLNGLLLLQYQAFLKGLQQIAPYPRGLHGLWIARFTTPVRLVAWLWARLG